MDSRQSVDHADIQALARVGHGHLPESRFLVLGMNDPVEAGLWLRQTRFSSARLEKPLPDSATQIAFTAAGLGKLGLADDTLQQFSDEFLEGMSGNASRSRQLGDVGRNSPERWQWGHSASPQMHALLLLYARADNIESHVQAVCDARFTQAFTVLHQLPTDTLKHREPFGFIDGISQPAIDWQQDQRTDVHARAAFSNLLAPGEIVLGHANEYGQLTRRALLADDHPQASSSLPKAHDAAGHRDLGGNGSYLIVRQLEQDVGAFWRFMLAEHPGDLPAAEALAATLVGRQKNGEPLVPATDRAIPGIPASRHRNRFDYVDDPDGAQCPIGAHVRRSNPRTGDFPPGVSGLLSRLIRMSGFGRRTEHEDLVASTRFHRVLRRGRTYGGPILKPLDAARLTPGRQPAQGLQFICLAANISRQFEFIQAAWLNSPTFAGTREQRDPLLGHRQARLDGSATHRFMQATAAGPQEKIHALPEFVTVRGGGYFFMPGLQAIRYLGDLASGALSDVERIDRPNKESA